MEEKGANVRRKSEKRKHTHTQRHFRVDVGKSRKHDEKNGCPEGRQACDGMKTKKKLRQARRTRSPLQHAARTGAARKGASCREADLRPTQRRLNRPAVVYVFLIFALRLHPFPSFSVSPYIRMYVRALFGPVGACVRLCLRVLAAGRYTLGNPRARHSNCLLYTSPSPRD